MAEQTDAAPEPQPEADVPQGDDPNRATLRLRYDRAETSYANVVFVTSMPAEVILNFGLNAMPPVRQREINVEVADRVVLSYPTAKRLAVMLGNVVKRYEDAHGTIEIRAQEAVPPPAEGQTS